MNCGYSYSCDVCFMQFDQELDLICHQTFHSGDIKTPTNDKTFSCDLCEIVFVEENDLLRHQAVHDNQDFNIEIVQNEVYKPKPMSCDTSEDNFSTKKTSPKLFSCDVCQIVYDSKGLLEQHLNTKYHNKRVNTVKAKKSSLNNKEIESNFESDFQTEVIIETFSCDICEIVYNTKELLEQHFSTKYHNKRANTAKVKKSLSNQLPESHFDLNNKKVRDQTEVLLETFSCDTCEIVYHTKELLEQHFSTKYHIKRAKTVKDIKSSMNNQVTGSHFGSDCQKDKDLIQVMFKIFSCDICEIVYDTKELLEQHFSTKYHNKRVEVQKLSMNRQVTESSFESDCQKDKDQTEVMFEIFSCGICEKDYDTKELLATHCETKYHKKRKLNVSDADVHF